MYQAARPPLRRMMAIDQALRANRENPALLKVMVDASTPPSTRVRAADSVLDHLAKAIELEDIEVRVRALEEATQTKGSRR